MARKRMIDPSFWTDEKLGTCEPLARLLFAGLISQADDEGRLPGHPALIRSQIFPYDISISIEMIVGWLEQLESKKMIIRYEIDGQSYIAIRNFLKYQMINRPTPSKIPAPPDDSMSDKTIRSNESKKCDEDSLNTHEQLNEDSLNTHSEKNRKEKNRKEDEENARTRASEKPSSLSSSSVIPFDQGFAEVCKTFEREGFGFLSPIARDELSALYEEFGAEWVLNAMRESVTRGKRTISFIRGILLNWRNEGGMRCSGYRRKESDTRDKPKKETVIKTDPFLLKYGGVKRAEIPLSEVQAQIQKMIDEHAS